MGGHHSPAPPVVDGSARSRAIGRVLPDSAGDPAVTSPLEADAALAPHDRSQDPSRERSPTDRGAWLSPAARSSLSLQALLPSASRLWLDTRDRVLSERQAKTLASIQKVLLRTLSASTRAYLAGLLVSGLPAILIALVTRLTQQLLLQRGRRPAKPAVPLATLLLGITRRAVNADLPRFLSILFGTFHFLDGIFFRVVVHWSLLNRVYRPTRIRSSTRLAGPLDRSARGDVADVHSLAPLSGAARGALPAGGHGTYPGVIRRIPHAATPHAGVTLRPHPHHRKDHSGSASGPPGSSGLGLAAAAAAAAAATPANATATATANANAVTSATGTTTSTQTGPSLPPSRPLVAPLTIGSEDEAEDSDTTATSESWSARSGTSAASMMRKRGRPAFFSSFSNDDLAGEVHDDHGGHDGEAPHPADGDDDDDDVSVSDSTTDLVNLAWKGVVTKPQIPKFVAGVIAGACAYRSLRRPRPDFALFMGVRALDSLIQFQQPLVSSMFAWVPRPIYDHADTVVFVLSSWEIMRSWFYCPDALPKSYANWITSMADIEPPILEALKLSKEGLVSYTKPMPDNQLAVSAMDTLKLPLSWGNADFGQFPCWITHGDLISCPRHWWQIFWSAFQRALRIYVPVHLIPALIFSRPKTMDAMARMLQRTTFHALHSTTFLSMFVTIIWSSICVVRRTTGQDTALGPTLGSFLCGLSILLERRSRRREMGIYTLPKAIESLLFRTGMVRQSEHWFMHLDLMLFTVSMGYLFSGLHVPGAVRPTIKALMGYFVLD
ncbi:hypothetical protein CXG81DRAFT_19841 [Caulochytrium protostelioides]|uniref:Transmembrane protein 135 N-terminal domain-containing protein n=1 Tax=Caulochytrium protostelioides TaxID=1555241 RepID=A0A4P9X531_9FUNG|nr:hypothetical protein CXG81DRAFT_19841 [Caulochytrium protostelioides]|eukprot:RKP00182.1 hypothetical protein CXG81DRAFT_19841 [Caulochytrium protostelioides]